MGCAEAGWSAKLAATPAPGEITNARALTRVMLRRPRAAAFIIAHARWHVPSDEQRTTIHIEMVSAAPT